MPVDLPPQELDAIDRMVSNRRRLLKGQRLYVAGQPFQALYAVRSGTLKSVMTSDEGRSQVTGFFMSGEILGLEGILENQHTCDAIALEDAEVCIIPYEELNTLSRQFPALQSHVHRVMSRELVKDHGTLMMLGSMRAEERVAAFLLNLIDRLQKRGFSSSELVLRMTRDEIGSFLGLKLETVSRTFSKFVEDGLIEARQRHIRILRPDALAAMTLPNAKSAAN